MGIRARTRIAAVAVFLGFACIGVCAGADFEIFIGRQRVDFEPYGGVEGYYDEPLDRSITVTKFPLPFDVVIKNISDSAKPVFEEVDAGAGSSVSIELTGEDGALFEMKKQPADTAAFDDEVSQFLNPGEIETIPLVVDPRDWENVPALEPGKVKKYRMRVAYQNDAEKIYSGYYDLILDGKDRTRGPDG